MSEDVHVRLVRAEDMRVTPFGEPSSDRLDYGEAVVPVESDFGQLLIQAHAQDTPITWNGRDYLIASLEVRPR